MKKILSTLLVVAAAATATISTASAQSVYFGVGSGSGYYGGGPYYRTYSRPYYRPYYRPYGAYSSGYGYADCYYRTRRYFNDYRGVWVVRRVRVCN